MRVGLVGTGFIARGIARTLERAGDLRLGAVLTRRRPADVRGFPDGAVTGAVDELLARSDVVVEASGDAVHATDVLVSVVDAGLPIVTMDSELQVTTGSWFASRGYITEADGDQPGCLARLHGEAVSMGFTPRAYVNLKGFLNLDPEPEEMFYWARRQQLRVEQVVSFTDGSKLQVEQALVANGLGAEIAAEGLIGATVADLHDTEFLAEHGVELGGAVSDFVLAKGAPPGVMILAEHADAAALGDYGPTARIRTVQGNFFVLVRPYHLCHLEVVRTLRDVAAGAPPLLNNSASPRIGVAAVAKRDLAGGTRLERGIGSFELRGTAVRLIERPDALPLCLAAGAHLRRDVEAGSLLSFDDVDPAPSRALELYCGLRDRACAEAESSLVGKTA